MENDRIAFMAAFILFVAVFGHLAIGSLQDKQIREEYGIYGVAVSGIADEPVLFDSIRLSNIHRRQSISFSADASDNARLTFLYEAVQEGRPSVLNIYVNGKRQVNAGDSFVILQHVVKGENTVEFVLSRITSNLVAEYLIAGLAFCLSFIISVNYAVPSRLRNRLFRGEFTADDSLGDQLVSLIRMEGRVSMGRAARTLGTDTITLRRWVDILSGERIIRVKRVFLRTYLTDDDLP
ncbi:MAG: hypothetical protein ABH879_07050 [archaeon]